MVGNAAVPIVVTGAGAPGIRGTIYALRHNPDSREVFIVGVDAASDAVGRYMVDAFEQVPNPEEHAYMERLRGICVRYSARIVVPQTTREVITFAAHRDELHADGIEVMVSDARAVEAANSKYNLLLACEQADVPFPKFRLASCECEIVAAAEALGYPDRAVVVKPPVSNGMRGVRVLRSGSWDVKRFLSEKPSGLEISLNELLRILRRGPGWPQLLVTEYLPGIEYTVDLFIGDKVKIALPRIRKQIRSGITFCSESDARPDIAEYSLRLAEKLGLQYAVGFQFKLNTEGTPEILECNPRVQGTMVAAGFSGANLIWMGVRELLGNPVSEVPECKASQFLRFWGGIGIDGDVAHEI